MLWFCIYILDICKEADSAKKRAYQIAMFAAPYVNSKLSRTIDEPFGKIWALVHLLFMVNIQWSCVCEPLR